MATLQKLENRVYNPKIWVTVPCPVCGSDNPIVYEKFGDRWQYTHNICSDCGMVYCSPRPKYDDDFIFEAYEFYAGEEHEIHEDYATVSERNPGIHQDFKDIIKFDTSAHSILDIGCGTGTFLSVAKEYFENAYGLDVSKRMAAYVEHHLGVKVFTEKFEDLSEKNKFSTIYMSHVIEHIPDPHLWLKKAKELLRPGGILVVKVPHIMSLNKRLKVFLKRIRLRKGKWEPWRTPDHLFEGTISGMRRLFELNDFEILSEFSYSRKNQMSDSFLQRFFYRRLMWANNLRYIVRPK